MRERKAGCFFVIVVDDDVDLEHAAALGVADAILGGVEGADGTSGLAHRVLQKVGIGSSDIWRAQLEKRRRKGRRRNENLNREFELR